MVAGMLREAERSMVTGCQGCVVLGTRDEAVRPGDIACEGMSEIEVGRVFRPIARASEFDVQGDVLAYDKGLAKYPWSRRDAALLDDWSINSPCTA
jgi:hypothetical protein